MSILTLFSSLATDVSEEVLDGILDLMCLAARSDSSGVGTTLFPDSVIRSIEPDVLRLMGKALNSLDEIRFIMNIFKKRKVGTYGVALSRKVNK